MQLINAVNYLPAAAGRPADNAALRRRRTWRVPNPTNRHRRAGVYVWDCCYNGERQAVAQALTCVAMQHSGDHPTTPVDCDDAGTIALTFL